jgi:predicted NUDIX family NTP pyrophosphohydrolase
MPKKSAGLLMYKKENNIIYYFIVHPGGPFWKDKDEHAWSIPKGEIEEAEKNNELDTAIRETWEETGIQAEPPFIDLGEIRQKSGKVVHAWAFEGDFSGIFARQHFIEIEYPIKSGKKIKIPEVDRGDMFKKQACKEKLNPAQFEFIERLEKLLV